MSVIRVGIVGVGKIVRDQHLPAIAGDARFVLAGAASRNATVDGVACFRTIEEMLDAAPLDAVVLCMPPQHRYRAAAAALDHGKHVFLEKPPGATLGEVEDLAGRAAAGGRTLFASWHSRYAPAVEQARHLLADAPIEGVGVVWREDVRTWHPGQAWIWQPGGFGVFDPGINALSIVTHILPRPLHLTRAILEFPANRAAPIAAALAFSDAAGLDVTADFDWRQTGKQTWDIRVRTTTGCIELVDGGARLLVDGKETPSAEAAEYPLLYARFARLVDEGRSDVDVSPLRHVADAFLLGERREVAAFDD